MPVLRRSTIVVSGLPGAGKTTLGRAVAERLALPFLDKDDILEDLFAGDPDPAARRGVLSRKADAILAEQAARQPVAVIVSFWRRVELSMASGTPTEWFSGRSDVIELWCDCPAEIAALRFLRRVRHPAHGDTVKRPDEVITSFQRLASLGPLGLGRLVRVDTSVPVDLAALASQLDVADRDDRRSER